MLSFWQCQQVSTADIIKKSSEQLKDSPERLNYKSNRLALTNVNFYDGLGHVLKTHQTIIIEDGKFKRIGNEADITISKDMPQLDLEGKTMIPGLVGTHNHLHIPRYPNIGLVAARLYLASGVTTIQTCGAAAPFEELKLSKAIAKNTAIGPEIIPSAPFINGEGGNPNMIIPADERQLRDTIRYWTNQGVTWFKNL